MPTRTVTETTVITLSDNLYPVCPAVPLEGDSLGDVLDHHERLVPAYNDCRNDVIRALEYIEEQKAQYRDQ